MPPQQHPQDQPEDDSPEEAPNIGYQITSGGFYAQVESIAYETENSTTNLWFLSAVGTQQSCRTIAAKLLKLVPDNAVLQPNRAAAEAGLPWHFNTRRANSCPTPWTFSVKQLPESRAWHLVVTPLMALHDRNEPQFLLLAPEYGTPDPETLARLHYTFIDRRTREPVHPTWAQWLWENAIHQEETRLLPGIGRRAYLCQPDYDRLSIKISTAVANGTLTV